MFSSVASHLNSVSHDLPLFTFHLTLASKFLGTYTVLMVSSGLSLTICGVCPCCSGSSGMALAPCRCPLSSQIPMFPSSPWFYGLCCFLLWHFFVTTRESPLGQLAFSLFQLIYEAILGDRKTSLCFVAERDVVEWPRSSVTHMLLHLPLLFSSVCAWAPEVSKSTF